ncbi:hypothetical protein Dda_7924 [Drechslerella dactyloides]|uniref:Sodium/calcium exchanger membrane region domain-containing protein n=1 Tax=Drechslerella dactyloides TaxID=74499 RepID=A0AAD6ISX5_DREDA|nr:hypothetical protein Dda_7924 [Drechslerella dactyloides]
MENTVERLPLLPNLFQLKKEQWNAGCDVDWYTRDAVSLAPDIVETLANVEYIANHIDDDPASPTFGFQNSHQYRPDGAQGSNVNNARLMEPISTLSFAYVLDKPWNPYRHHPILRVRLIAAINYWLRIQAPSGGWAELGGPSTAHVAPTSFSLNFLVEMMYELDYDASLDEDVRTRLRAAVYKAAELCATDQQYRNVGYDYSNQYTCVFYVLWRLWEITNDSKWKNYYDARLNEWLAKVQQCPFYVERGSVEVFGYSHVTEWVLDRVYARNKDPRILESLRRYYDWGCLNTVPENEVQTFITDVVGNGRTTETAQFGEVGYYNNITQYLPNSQAFAVRYLISAAERDQRLRNWPNNPIPPTGNHPGLVGAFHIFHNWPMYFRPHGLWTVTPDQQKAAVAKLPPVAQTKFTRYFGPPRAGTASYLFARRPGVYVTFHFGQRNNSQAKEAGIVWLPGFGTLIRGTTANINWAFCTRTTSGKTTFKTPITDFQLPAGWSTSTSADGTVTSPDDLAFTSTFGGIGIRKTYKINNLGFELSVTPTEAGTEQIPLYLDATDEVYIDTTKQTKDMATSINYDNLIFNVCAFITGLFLLDYGADKFVDHTAVIARRLGISATLIGLLTAGAEWEELVVVVASIAQNNSALALGNILGSSISNILGAFSLGLLFSRDETIRFDHSSKIYVGVLSIITTVFCFFLAVYRVEFGRFGGALFCGAFILYISSIAYGIYRGVMSPPEDSDSDSDSDSSSDSSDDESSDDDDEEAAKHLKKTMEGYRSSSSISEDAGSSVEAIPLRAHRKSASIGHMISGPGPHNRNVSISQLNARPRKVARSIFYHCFQLLLGFITVSISGYVLSHSVGTVGDAFNLSDTLLGVTVLSFATTLPEKFVAVVGGRKGQGGIVVANTAGSNIFLLTLCAGVLFLAGDLKQLVKSVTSFEIIMTWISSAVFTVIVFYGGKRWMGTALLLLYIVFILLEFVLGRGEDGH